MIDTVSILKCFTSISFSQCKNYLNNFNENYILFVVVFLFFRKIFKEVKLQGIN